MRIREKQPPHAAAFLVRYIILPLLYREAADLAALNTNYVEMGTLSNIRSACSFVKYPSTEY